MPKDHDEPEAQNPWQQAGMAMSIPTLMVAGPLLGVVIGMVLEQWLNLQAPWAFRVKAFAVVLCTLASARETIKVLKRISGAKPPKRRS